MTQKDDKNIQPAMKKPTDRPNDTGSVHVEGFVKIFDPNTQETFVEKRA
jgi:hypothetical protein